MSRSRIFICVNYHGEWNRSNGVWDWVGQSLQCKGIMFERSVNFEEFIDKVYMKTGISKNEYSIEVRHKCPGDLFSQPILISDDVDLADFFCLYADEKAVAVYVESKVREIGMVGNENGDGDGDGDGNGDGDDGQRQFSNDDYFGLQIVEDRISRREPDFGCYGEALQVSRVRRSNEKEIDSNSTPATAGDLLIGQSSNPGYEDGNQYWDQQYGDPVPAIGWNEERNEVVPEFVEDEGFQSHREMRSLSEFRSQSEFHSQASEDINRRHDGSDLAVGQRFETKDNLNYKLRLVAIEGKFEMKTEKSTKRVKVVTCVDDNCSWRLRAVRPEDSTVFEIRRYNGYHTCTMMNRSIHHRQASSVVIASRMKGHFESTKTPPKPKMVAEFVRNELEVQCSYWKAWKATKVAEDLIRGTPEHSFSILPSYCYMLKMANPGTVTHIEVDEEDRFKYFFLALGAQIRGFRCMRKVIGVDGAWMKGRIKGVLLVASTEDSEFHSYPIAWGVVDSENNASWTWFLEKLKELIPDDPDLCFISDRGHSIEHAVNLVYPQVTFEIGFMASNDNVAGTNNLFKYDAGTARSVLLSREDEYKEQI